MQIESVNTLDDEDDEILVYTLVDDSQKTAILGCQRSENENRENRLRYRDRQ